MTDRYFVFVEQPLALHLPTMAAAVLTGAPMVESMRWRGDRGTVFHVVHRITGEEIKLRYKYCMNSYFLGIL